MEPKDVWVVYDNDYLKVVSVHALESQARRARLRYIEKISVTCINRYLICTLPNAIGYMVQDSQISPFNP